MMDIQNIEGFQINIRFLKQSDELYDMGYRAAWDVRDKDDFRINYGVATSYVMAFAEASEALSKV